MRPFESPAPTPTSVPRPTGVELRREPRVEVNLAIRYRVATDPWRESTARNVSGSGLFVATGDPLPTGTEVRFELRDGPHVVRGIALVQWSRRTDGGIASPPGMGLRLTSQHFADGGAWQALVRRHLLLACADVWVQPPPPEMSAPPAVVPWAERSEPTPGPGVAAPTPRRRARWYVPVAGLVLAAACGLFAALLVL